MNIGENIKRLRQIYDLSQKDLAEIAGVTDKAVSTWEIGVKEPRMGAIQKIADHFGFKKSNIIEDDGLKNIEAIHNHVLSNKENSFGSENEDLVRRFHAMSSIGQKMVLDMMDSIEKMERQK